MDDEAPKFDSGQVAILESLGTTNELLAKLVASSDESTAAANLAVDAVRENSRVNTRKIRWTRLLVLAVATLGAIGGIGIYRYAESRTSSCSEKRERTEQIRGSMVAGMDEAGVFFEVPDAQREAVIGRVEYRIRQKYPDPDC